MCTLFLFLTYPLWKKFIIYEFGVNLGIAFQLQDDYLDCFGDPQKFGKQVGGDIISNKKTFMMLNSFMSNSQVHIILIFLRQ